MYKVTRLLGAALCLLALVTTSLSAQGTTYQVNFGSIAFVNVQLDADCSRDIIYMNLLTGDPDLDGDGRVPTQEAFIIEIDDADPTNNEMLDGCGTFLYTIRPHPDSMIVGFTFGQGSITARDVTPPTQFLTAEANPGPFFTTQLQDLTINSLRGDISRSFIVDGQSGFPQMGTISGELMTRLLAGGDIPRFRDACSDVNVTVSDEVFIDGPCGDIVITRTFTATDESAECSTPDFNSGETVVSYDIVLERPRIADVQEPTELVTYECNDPALIGGNFPDPDPEDYPFLNTPDGPEYLDFVFGNVGASFTNSAPVNICNNTLKYVRTYTVIDWCDTDNVRTFSQLVKVGDTGAPTITLPTQDLDFDGFPDDGPLVYSTNAPGCGAYINTRASGLSITDGCSAVMTTTALVLFNGSEDNISAPINVDAPSPTDRLTPFIPAGEHTLRYHAIDECGNEITADLDILIEDRSGPVVIAEDAINVALSNNGFATVAATDIDRGSYDDCTDVTLDIAFANPVALIAIGAFSPTITLTCIDVGAVPVILRATDANGNSNTRMSIINVIDNSAPVCIAPGNLTIDCEQADELLPEDINAFFLGDPQSTIILFDDLFGAPTSLDNCGNEQSTQEIFANINDCGTGTVTRSFTVTDSRGFASAPGCDQIISIRGIRDYTLEFPGDASATCGNNPVYDDLVYTPLGCDMVVTNLTVDTFFATSDACFKLRRTIEVINWCEYDGNGDFYTVRRDADNDGNFDESTFLHILPNGNTDLSDDVAVLDRDASRVNNNNIGFLDIDDLTNGSIDNDNDGDSGYGNSISRGAFRYVQYVKVYDNTAPTITNISSDVTNSTDCDGGGIQIDFTILDDCIGANLSAVVEIDLDYVPANGFNASRVLTSEEVLADGTGGFNVLLPNLPIGEHAIRARATDGCGNVNGRIIQFDIDDNSVVTPICVGRLTFVLQTDGAGGGLAIVEADDFVVSTNGNCLNLPLEYAVYTEEEANATGFSPSPDRAEFDVTCEDLGEIPVRVYVFTPNGTSHFCNAMASVVTSATVSCTSAGVASISGFVTSPQNDLLRDVEVSISDMASMNEMQLTDANGSFLFPALAAGSQYMVQPQTSDEVNIRRVKTSDIATIAAHALGTSPLTDPYRLIAADVNGDGYVDISDMLAISRVIIGLDPTYQHSPTWRFIRRDFDLNGLEEGWNPSIFPTSYMIEELQGHNRNADFVAIEIGDVFVQPEGREAYALNTDDALLQAGERFDLKVTAGELKAFQGTFDVADGLEIENWSSSLLSLGNVNDAYMADGLLPFSYQADESLEGEEVITLHLLATNDLRISDYLSVTDRITYPEAYTPAGNTATLSLEFSETTGGDGIVLHQNFPNPASAQTTIVFELPQAGAVALEVHDLQGRLVAARNLEGHLGRNTVIFQTDNDLNNSTGILTYTLTVGQQRLTKRMTVIAR
ncbi:MAG: T9SS type A sorting domain-containing protein [Lewinella sp.]